MYECLIKSGGKPQPFDGPGSTCSLPRCTEKLWLPGPLSIGRMKSISTTGLQPIRWILQGSVVDPFGMYRIGKILE